MLQSSYDQIELDDKYACGDLEKIFGKPPKQVESTLGEWKEVPTYQPRSSVEYYPPRADIHLMETFHQLEKDPTGKSAHDPGSKLDQGKNRLGLVLGGFANALQAVGAVGTFGANKYTDNGWQSVPNGISRYGDAQLRHIFKEGIVGDKLDPDSKLLHAAHTAWNALARLELILKESDDDNT